MIGDAVRRRLIKGIGANIYSQVVIAGIQLVGIPILLRAWGTHTYGEWLILFALPSYLSMTDLGFSISAANDMTAQVARGNKSEALAVFQSIFAFLIFVTVIMITVIVATLFLLPDSYFFHLVQYSSSKTRLILLLLTCSVFMRIFDGINQAGFRSNGEYAVHATIYTTVGLTQQLSIWVTALLGYGLLGAALSYTVVTLVCIPCTSLFLVVRHRWLRFGFKSARFHEVRRLSVPALGNVGIPLAQSLSNQGMVIIVGTILGPSTLVAFSTLRTLTRLAFQILIGISNAAEPEFASFALETDTRYLENLFGQIMRLSFWSASPLILILFFFGNVIFKAWTSGKVPMNETLFLWLLATVMSQTLWNGSLSALRALNRHTTAAGFQFITSAIGVILSIVFLKETRSVSYAGFSLFVSDIILMQFITRRACSSINISLPHLLRFTLDPRPLFGFVSRSLIDGVKRS